MMTANQIVFINSLLADLKENFEDNKDYFISLSKEDLLKVISEREENWSKLLYFVYESYFEQLNISQTIILEQIRNKVFEDSIYMIENTEN